MNKLKEEFLKKEQALRLKDLGFFEPCMGVYRNGEIVITTDPKDHYYYEDSAVTYSQAFKWFWKEHKLFSDVFLDDDQTFGYLISSFVEGGRIDKPIVRQFITPEEAENACIDMLIELKQQEV